MKRAREEQNKNGMKVVDNMDGAKNATEKLNTDIAFNIKNKDIKNLPGRTMKEKLERALKRPIRPGENFEKLIEELKKSKRLVN